MNSQTPTLPLTEASNPALIHDYQKQGLMVYLKDLEFDEAGRPVILFLTTHGWEPGPANGPRVWYTTQWAGKDWMTRAVTTSDHNYDHGSLYIESDGTWRVIAPTEPGPHVGGTGGEIVVRTSHDLGAIWQLTQKLTVNNGRNQTYVRKPVNAHPDFYAFWADGNAFERSESNLYFAAKDGRVFRLPDSMRGNSQVPLLLAGA